MACPYIHNGNNTTEMPSEMTTTRTIIVGGPVKNRADPLNYTRYLGITTLLSALRCLSHTDPADENSPPVHDEHFFIITHQAFELWFKQILFELDSIRKQFETINDLGVHFFTINLRLARVNNIWKILTEQLDLLDSMTPIEFLEFRNYITPASGFQSHQFRLIEMKLGLTDPFRQSFRAQYFTETMFRGEQSQKLVQSIEETSLLVYIERWLEHIYDQMPFDFLTEYRQAVTRFIEHEKKEKILNGTDQEQAEREAETAHNQFISMIEPNEYNRLLAEHERRISQRAMLVVLMISMYHKESCFQQAYEMLRLLMDMDGLMNSWRHGHLRLVQRQIGRKPGTGGTAGFAYLMQTLSNKYQIFIDFYNVSSYLIPQKFLPNITFDLKTLGIADISAIRLSSPQSVPLIRQTQPTPESTTKPIIQYYLIGFYLLIFVAGTFFSFLFR